jgi:hypothetical protein
MNSAGLRIKGRIRVCQTDEKLLDEDEGYLGGGDEDRDGDGEGPDAAADLGNDHS